MDALEPVRLTPPNAALELAFRDLHAAPDLRCINVKHIGSNLRAIGEQPRRHSRLAQDAVLMTRA